MLAILAVVVSLLLGGLVGLVSGLVIGFALGVVGESQRAQSEKEVITAEYVLN